MIRRRQLMRRWQRCSGRGRVLAAGTIALVGVVVTAGVASAVCTDGPVQVGVPAATLPVDQGGGPCGPGEGAGAVADGGGALVGSGAPVGAGVPPVTAVGPWGPDCAPGPGTVGGVPQPGAVPTAPGVPAPGGLPQPNQPPTPNQLPTPGPSPVAGQLPTSGRPSAPGPTSGTVRTLTYDLSGAAPYADSIRRAVAIWNSRVHNVRLSAGSPAAITIVAENGWPHAEPDGLGAGRVVIGSQAVGQGYDPTRIAAHELGHILGLQDDYNGVCADLMSGHSAGTSCRNAGPSSDEAARVDAAFAGGAGQGTPPPAVGP